MTVEERTMQHPTTRRRSEDKDRDRAERMFAVDHTIIWHIFPTPGAAPGRGNRSGWTSRRSAYTVSASRRRPR